MAEARRDQEVADLVTSPRAGKVERAACQEPL